MRRAKALALVGALAVGGLLAVEVFTPDYSCDGTVVIVQEGDTLSRIAEQHCTGDVRAAVEALVDRYGADIRPTQEVRLP
ncbi:MAG: hypothetical protein EBS91_00270 [Betaproteobacteria bacterium]|nr:hypothetical protein [Betaproteobacteria bacterium]NCA23070.1 hypothetical protein [Betaproteobacteria bacterium]